MKYLEDTLAEQCLSKALYPNTKIIVTRKKVEGTLLTYTNELEVEVDFSDVDPTLLENLDETEKQAIGSISQTGAASDLTNESKVSENSDQADSTITKKASRFFRNK